MNRRRRSVATPRVSRRTALASLATVGAAGCLEDERSDDLDDGENDVSDESRALAAEMIDAIDPALSVAEWTFGGMLVPKYTDSGGVEADVPILGDAYADVVDRGFDHRAMPTALDERGGTDFMVFLEVEWASAYLDGEWSREEYYEEILVSEH